MRVKSNGRVKLLVALVLSVVDYVAVEIEFMDLAAKVAQVPEMLYPTFLFTYPSTLVPFVIWFALLMLRVKRPEGESCPKLDWTFSVLFSCCLLIFHSFWSTGSFDAITANKGCVMLFIGSFFGLSLFFENLLVWLRCCCRRLAGSDAALPGIWVKHPFLFPFAVIFICWLPFAVLKYPAATEFDAFFQLHQILGYSELTNHWPVFASAIYGLCFTLGKTVFGSVDAGFFTLIICQMLFCAACFAYALKVMKKLGLAPSLLMLCLFIWAVLTVVSRYCTSLNKDCWFSCAVLLCLSYGVELLYGKKEPGNRETVIFALLCLLVGLLRSNGPHIILFWFLSFGLAWIIRREKGYIRLFSAALAAFVLCMCYLNILIPALGIRNPSSAEALSIPFMQTARYVKCYPDEVTAEEAEIIDGVLDYDRIAEVYDPRIADPVKISYHGDSQALMRYFKVWLRQGLRHPEVYFSATLDNIVGFFYPGAAERAPGVYVNYGGDHQLTQMSGERSIARDFRLRNYEALVLCFEAFPPVYFFSNIAVNMWLLIYMFIAVLCRKNRKFLLVLVPSLVGLLVCVASPTFTHNGFRYALPIVFANPFILSLFLQQLFPKTEKVT